MRRAYFLFASLIVLISNDLFLVSKSWETVRVILFFGMNLVFLIFLILVLVKKKEAWSKKLTVAIAALVLITIYYFSGGLIEHAAANLSFSIHRSKYEDFASTVEQKVNTIYKEQKDTGKQTVFVSDMYDQLFADKNITDKKNSLGLWDFDIVEISQGQYEVQMSIVDGKEEIGLAYSPTGEAAYEEPVMGKKTFWRKDKYWFMWETANGGMGAPM